MPKGDREKIAQIAARIIGKPYSDFDSVCSPDACQGKGRPFALPCDAEPDVGRRIAPLGFAEAGGRDQATALLEAPTPEGRRAQLVIAGV